MAKKNIRPTEPTVGGSNQSEQLKTIPGFPVGDTAPEIQSKVEWIMRAVDTLHQLSTVDESDDAIMQHIEQLRQLGCPEWVLDYCIDAFTESSGKHELYRITHVFESTNGRYVIARISPRRGADYVWILAIDKNDKVPKLSITTQNAGLPMLREYEGQHLHNTSMHPKLQLCVIMHFVSIMAQYHEPDLVDVVEDECFPKGGNDLSQYDEDQPTAKGGSL